MVRDDLMDEASFDLLLNDPEYLERIESGEFVAVDQVMSVDQIRRIALRLHDRQDDGVVLGQCPHGVDLDREFCEQGCRV